MSDPARIESWEYVAFYDGAKALDMVNPNRILNSITAEKFLAGIQCNCKGKCPCHTIDGGAHPNRKCKEVFTDELHNSSSD